MKKPAYVRKHQDIKNHLNSKRGKYNYKDVGLAFGFEVAADIVATLIIGGVCSGAAWVYNKITHKNDVEEEED